MSDNKKAIGGQDRKRIAVSEDYELRDGATKFGVPLTKSNVRWKPWGDSRRRSNSHRIARWRGGLPDGPA